MSTITRPSGCPSPSPAAPTKTTIVPDEERGVMRDVSYNLYDRLSGSLSEHTSIRLAYDGKDIEVMVVGPIHDQLKELIGVFIHEVSTASKSIVGRKARRRGIGPRWSGAWKPTSAITSTPPNWRPVTRRSPVDPTTSPTIPTPTWRSKSTSRRPRSTGLASMPRSRSPRSGGSRMRQ